MEDDAAGDWDDYEAWETDEGDEEAEKEGDEE